MIARTERQKGRKIRGRKDDEYDSEGIQNLTRYKRIREGRYLVMARQSSKSLWLHVRMGIGNPRRSREEEVT